MKRKSVLIITRKMKFCKLFSKKFTRQLCQLKTGVFTAVFYNSNV